MHLHLMRYILERHFDRLCQDQGIQKQARLQEGLSKRMRSNQKQYCIHQKYLLHWEYLLQSRMNQIVNLACSLRYK